MNLPLAHGIDLVDFARIESMIEQHGQRFLDRVFTAREQTEAAGVKNRIEKLAGRFAAKEAVMKLVGTGWRGGVAWTDIEVTNGPMGEPRLEISGEIRRVAEQMGIGTDRAEHYAHGQLCDRIGGGGAGRIMTAGAFDCIVVGGGHAGAEAAWAASRLGARTALVTMSRETIAKMSCNPAIGGLAKGQIVREIDALGGLMGEAIDATGIQFRTLNRSKGPAVQSPRAQADKYEYKDWVRRRLESAEGLTIIEGMAAEVIVENGAVAGVSLADGRRLSAAAVILTTGTFLRGILHCGDEQWPGGRLEEPASNELSDCLRRLGLTVGRLKTGTPARLAGDTIDYGTTGAAGWRRAAGAVFVFERADRPAAGSVLDHLTRIHRFINSCGTISIGRRCIRGRFSRSGRGTVRASRPRSCGLPRRSGTRFFWSRKIGRARRSIATGSALRCRRMCRIR